MATIKSLETQLESLKNKLCNCCKVLPSTIGVPTSAPTNGQNVKIDLSTGIIYYYDSDTSTWESISSGSGGGIVEVTRNEAETLVTSDGLIPGSTYKITDRGDRGIFLTAITTSEFSTIGQRVMLIPATYEYGASVTYNATTYTSKSIFNTWELTNVGYLENEFVIFNGHFWRCIAAPLALGGAVYSASIQDVLDAADWVRIEKTDLLASAMYVEKVFDIKYDFENDWIFEQSDRWNNVVGIGYSTFNGYTFVLTANPVDYTDWGLAEYMNQNADPVSSFIIEGNKLRLGFYNNSGSGLGIGTIKIINNTCSCVVNNFVAASAINIVGNHTRETSFDGSTIGGIVNNQFYSGDTYILNNDFNEGINNNVGVESITNNNCFRIDNNSVESIIDNHIIGIIMSNSGGRIWKNINRGDISDNQTDDGIFNNSNLGGIQDNICPSGEISFNTNAGGISSNTCASIERNSNIGDIALNAHNGTIENNSNSGFITNCVGAGGFNVINNTNNGVINNPAGLAAANVSDATVNK